MEFEFKGNRIIFNRGLLALDRLVLKFVKILEKNSIDYVIISGYIAILFGRSRQTEDVDIFIEEMPFEKFKGFWDELHMQGFWCINASSAESAFNDYLNHQLAIRFALENQMQPNFELKFPKTKYNKYSIKHKIEVILNNGKLMTSELELQIAFKLSLGSEKDFEDAWHLYIVLKEHLDINLLKNHIKELGVEKRADKVLWQREKKA